MATVTFYARGENDPREVNFSNSAGESIVVDFSSGKAQVDGDDHIAIARLSEMASDPTHPVQDKPPTSTKKEK